MFQRRMTVLAVVFVGLFMIALGRLWQLQVVRADYYRRLARGERKFEEALPAPRGGICDRYGEVLAQDRTSLDLALRTDLLSLKTFSRKEIKEALTKLADAGTRKKERARLRERLSVEPWVCELARLVRRSAEETAKGVAGALEAVARKWVTASTSVVFLRDVPEEEWETLRTWQEDVYRRPGRFPGLVCRFSLRRVYPWGSTAAHVLGILEELAPEELKTLRRRGVLWNHDAARRRWWRRRREKFNEEEMKILPGIIGTDPRTCSFDELARRLANLSPKERRRAAAAGLSAPVRWFKAPPALRLVEAERLWLGVGRAGVGRRLLLDNRRGGSGVEAYYNDLLRGKQGLRLTVGYVGKNGRRVTKHYQGGEPREGQRLRLTLSLAWQRACENALASREGDSPAAAVVLDCRNGEILAMASSPTFDPNLFSPPRDNYARRRELAKLTTDERKPLLNRCCAEQYPLGSVMKPLIASAALQLGVVSPDEVLYCPGRIRLGRRMYHCDSNRAHGDVDLTAALRRSCNIYFFQVGARVGVERLAPFAEAVGFGRRTAGDLFFETPGIYPDRRWRRKHWPHNRRAQAWSKGKDYNLAIGQGEFVCTPLQAACMMAAIANGGTTVTPHLRLGAPAPKGRFGVSPRHLEFVRRALDEVVNVGTPGQRGTAWRAFHQGGPELAVRVAGKTGTADHGGPGKPHAWFAGFAPSAAPGQKAEPRVAFAVVVERGGHGGAAAAPIARNFLAEIYGTGDHPNPHPGCLRPGERPAAREARGREGERRP